MKQVNVEILGKIDYKNAWEYQTQLHNHLIAQKRAIRSGDLDVKTQSHSLLFCEHNPVYTLGRSGDVAHLLLDEKGLEKAGIQYYKINRGGDITYHGPGQWTVYPIFDLDEIFTDVHKYVRLLEQCVINVCADYGLEADREKDYTGVWLGTSDLRRKICAIGVHLSRWVTLHGLAFNINTDLSHFKGIVPCGIQETQCSVTSLQKELGRTIDMAEVQKKIQKQFIALFALELTS